MAYDFASRLRLTSLVACAAIAGACVPSTASAQDIVMEAITVPFAVAPTPYAAADVVVADPYYRHPAYPYRNAPAYSYAPAYGLVCGYDAWNRWACYLR